MSIALIVTSLVAAVGCVLYARAGGRRVQRVAWSVLAIPLVYHAVIYAWIAFYNPPLEARVYPVRLASIMEHVLIAFITITLTRADYKRRNG